MKTQPKLHTLYDLKQNLAHAISFDNADLPIQKVKGSGLRGMDSTKADLGWLENKMWDEHYVFGREDCDYFMKNEALKKNSEFIVNNGLFRLPHKKCVVELVCKAGTCILQFSEDEHEIININLLYLPALEGGETSRNIVRGIAVVENIRLIFLNSGTEGNKDIDVIYPEAFVSDFDTEEDLESIKEGLGLFIYAGLIGLITVYSVRGITSEVNKPHKGQVKKAIKQGTAPPTKFRSLKLDFVTDKSGNEYKLNSNDSIKTMHLRSAHMRRQRYGKGNKDIKYIHIEACLVNYKPDEEVTVRSTGVELSKENN